jgi:succinate dehydrogenase/fumarate reductase flavoprotein subunit
MKHVLFRNDERPHRRRLHEPRFERAITLARHAREIETWNEKADVVIIGMGAAGASAAIEARDQGADVLVLERAAHGGGSTSLSGGIIYFGGGTETQRACGFSDGLDELYKYLLAASGPNPDEVKVRLYCERNLER